jgi:hypothetical protein|tara:strand:+ start:628 stop:909 length:282 start_codon:yes stop_codon:yes gene_type:complete
MALTKEQITESINVFGEYKSVQIAEDTVVKEDGTELSRSRHRRVLHPGYISGSSYVSTDISGESSEIQGICNISWTDSVKTAWEAKCKADKGL